MTHEFMYWLIIGPKVAGIMGAAAGVILIFGGIIGGFALLMTKGEVKDENWKKVAKAWCIAIPTCMVITLASQFVPTTKELVAIYAVPKIANNERVANIGDKSFDLIETQLEAWLKEMKEDVSESTETSAD